MDELEIVKVEDEQPIEDEEKPIEEPAEEEKPEGKVPLGDAIDAIKTTVDNIKDAIDADKADEQKIDEIGDDVVDKLADIADEEVWEGENADEEIPEAETYYDDEIIDEPVEEPLTEASTAEKRAFKNGGEDAEDLIQGKAIARIKDPKDREAAIAAKKAGRDDVVKQFTGDRKDDQASAAYEKKADKMEKAGVLDEGIEEVEDLPSAEDDELIQAFIDAELGNDNEPVIEEELTPYEQRKQRALEMYNRFNEWANDAKDRTSCLCNVSVDQLNEWLEEDNND